MRVGVDSPNGNTVQDDVSVGGTISGSHQRREELAAPLLDAAQRVSRYDAEHDFLNLIGSTRDEKDDSQLIFYPSRVEIIVQHVVLRHVLESATP